MQSRAACCDEMWPAALDVSQLSFRGQACRFALKSPAEVVAEKAAIKVSDLTRSFPRAAYDQKLIAPHDNLALFEGGTYSKDLHRLALRGKHHDPRRAGRTFAPFNPDFDAFRKRKRRHRILMAIQLVVIAVFQRQ